MHTVTKDAADAASRILGIRAPTELANHRSNAGTTRADAGWSVSKAAVAAS